MTDPAQPAKVPRRWKRALAFAIVAGAILLAVAWAPVALQGYDEHRERKAAEPRPIIASDAQQVEIMRALLDQREFEAVPPPPPMPGDPPREDGRRWPVLEGPSLAICGPLGQFDHVCEDDAFARSTDYLAAVPERFRRELLAANETSGPLPDPGVPQVPFGTAIPADWQAFRARHPDATGRLSVSRAVLSPDGREALLAARHGCGMTCGVFAVAWFVRDGSTWRLAEWVMLGQY